MSTQRIVFADEFFNDLHEFTEGDNEEQQRILDYIKEQYDAGELQPNVEYIFSPDTKEFLEIPDEMFEETLDVNAEVENRVYH
jgi:hypothetical protein